MFTLAPDNEIMFLESRVDIDHPKESEVQEVSWHPLVEVLTHYPAPVESQEDNLFSSVIW